MTDKTDSKEREAIIRAAVAAMPHTNPLVADDLLGGFTMHTEADDIVAIYLAGRASLAANAGREPVAIGLSDPLDALRWGASVAETLLSIGHAIGFGRAQQILGEQWEAAHNCAPRGRMGVTVGKCNPPKTWTHRSQNAYRRGWDDYAAAHPSPPEGMVGGWIALPGTLPEPGTPVLLDIGKKYPIRAMWATKFTVEASPECSDDWAEYDEAADTYYCPEGWYEWNEHEETHWRVTETPRAWTPLPPTTSAGSGKGE